MRALSTAHAIVCSPLRGVGVEQAVTIVVGGSVPVTLLGECALSRGTRPLTYTMIINKYFFIYTIIIN
jgi:hypothetical protein